VSPYKISLHCPCHLCVPSGNLPCGNDSPETHYIPLASDSSVSPTRAFAALLSIVSDEDDAADNPDHSIFVPPTAIIIADPDVAYPQVAGVADVASSSSNNHFSPSPQEALHALLTDNWESGIPSSSLTQLTTDGYWFPHSCR
jgi:hypothetical protein